MNKTLIEIGFVDGIKNFVKEVDATVAAAENLVRKVGDHYAVAPRLRECSGDMKEKDQK